MLWATMRFTPAAIAAATRLRVPISRMRALRIRASAIFSGASAGGRSVSWWMTISGCAFLTTPSSDGASNTSTITGSTPRSSSIDALSVERVVPATDQPSSTSMRQRRRPIAPPAPATKILVFGVPDRVWCTEASSRCRIGTSAMRSLQGDGDERRPRFVGLPNIVHEGECLLVRPALPDDAIQPQESGDPHVGRAVNPDRLAFVPGHDLEECEEIGVGGCRELNRNMHIAHAKRSNNTSLVRQGVTRIVMECQIDDKSKPSLRDLAQLVHSGLSGGAQPLVDSAVVADTAENGVVHVRVGVAEGTCFSRSRLNESLNGSTRTAFVYRIAQLSHAGPHLMNRHQAKNWAEQSARERWLALAAGDRPHLDDQFVL